MEGLVFIVCSILGAVVGAFFAFEIAHSYWHGVLGFVVGNIAGVTIAGLLTSAIGTIAKVVSIGVAGLILILLIYAAWNWSANGASPPRTAPAQGDMLSPGK